MNDIRFLTFEIGPACNLDKEHDWCPRHYMRRTGKMMDTAVIASSIRDALALGFSGHILFQFYNEPMLYQSRMAAVMDAVPEARYLLWTNGYDRQSPIRERFDLIHQTSYDGAGNYPFCPDTRIENYTRPIRLGVTCRRPLVEFPIDYTGEAHLCCQDWLGTHTFGNITSEPFETVYRRWRDAADNIVNGRTPQPGVCCSCTGVQC